jgi:hypothetical protein
MNGQASGAASPWDEFPSQRQIVTRATETYADAYTRALGIAASLRAPVLLLGRSGIPLLIALPGEAARIAARSTSEGGAS